MRKANYFTKSELAMFENQNPIFNTAQINIINRKTPDSEVEYKSDKSGFKYKSVKAAYVKALVTLVTGGNYSFEIKEQVFLSSAKEIRTTARLTIYANGQSYFRDQNGNSECNIPESNSYKASASDAFKKCASEFGFCWDIYGQEHADQKKEEIPEMNHADKKKLERLNHFLNQAATVSEIEHSYNKYLETAEETEASKELLKTYLNKFGQIIDKK